MKRNISKPLFVLEIIFCTLLIAQALRYWFDPFRWGWPSEIHLRAFSLLIFSVAMILLAQSFESSTKFTGGIRIVLMTFVLGFSLILGMFIIMYIPMSPEFEVVIAKLNIDEDRFEKLQPCEKVDIFAQIGYHFLDTGNRTVLVPKWLHTALSEIPEEIIGKCFSDELSKQLRIFQSSPRFNEVTVRKIYALAFETHVLGVQTDPSILAILKEAICNNEIDPFGSLTLDYYIAKTNAVPNYDYYSIEGREKLTGDVCNGR